MDHDKDQTWSLDDIVTITGTGASPHLDISTATTIDLSNISMGAVGSSMTWSQPYWGTDTITTSGISTSINQSGTIELRGEEADIIVNGVSLMDKLDAIAERLNILDVNKELEAEWDQLRELGERYRELEQELKAKSEMWKTLKTKTSNKPRS
jgi:hypothetical protein